MGPAERVGLAWEGAQGAEGTLTERGPWAGGGVWRLQWNVASRRFRTERRAGRASEAAVAWRQDPDPTAGPAGTVGAAPSGVCLCRAGPRAGTGHPVSKHQAGRAVRHGPRRFVPAPRLSRGPGGARGRVGPAGQQQPVPRWGGGPAALRGPEAAAEPALQRSRRGCCQHRARALWPQRSARAPLGGLSGARWGEPAARARRQRLCSAKQPAGAGHSQEAQAARPGEHGGPEVEGGVCWLWVPLLPARPSLTPSCTACRRGATPGLGTLRAGVCPARACCPAAAEGP